MSRGPFSGSLQIDGIWTDIFAQLSETPSPFRIVVIPGNPGNVIPYHRFIDILFSSLVSHAGHGSPGQNGDTVFSVNDQIEHKVAFITGLTAGQWPELNEIGTVQPNRYFLLGHSIGAYISLKTWGRLPINNGIILETYMLMPTICHLYNGYSYFNRFITLPYVRNMFAYVAHYIPPFLLRWILNGIATSQGDKLGEMVTTSIDYSVVMNITTMGHEEGSTIFEIDEEIANVLNSAAQKALFLFSPIDPYTPESIRDEIQTQFPQATYEMAGKDVSHAFVIESYVQIAQYVATKLEERNPLEFKKLSGTH